MKSGIPGSPAAGSVLSERVRFAASALGPFLFAAAGASRNRQDAREIQTAAFFVLETKGAGMPAAGAGLRLTSILNRFLRKVPTGPRG